MYYLDFLADAHRRLQPHAYLEIGVRNGDSLALADCPSVAIDPAFLVHAELSQPVSLFRTISDEYFTRPEPLAPTGGRPFELSFIDGLHLFEFALRDFIAAEQHSAAKGVIVLDDVLPRTVDEAARQRHTVAWTGDVFWVLEVLARYRPELIVVPVDTTPTGLLMVVGLDPESTALIDNYDDIMREFRRPDPQNVPPYIIDRTSVVSPGRFLEAGVLEALAGLPSDASADEVSALLQRLVSSALGEGFGAGREVNASVDASVSVS